MTRSLSGDRWTEAQRRARRASKDAEREVARFFAGKRTWWREEDVMVPDQNNPRIVVECKRRPLPKWLHEAVKQAQGYAGGDVWPIVALKEPQQEGFYIVMHSRDWEEYFGELDLG
jgi:hypothetical protein